MGETCSFFIMYSTVLPKLFFIAKWRRLESLTEEDEEACLTAAYWAIWWRIFFTTIVVSSSLPSESCLSFSSKLVKRWVKLCCGISTFWGRVDVVGITEVEVLWPRKFKFFCSYWSLMLISVPRCVFAWFSVFYNCAWARGWEFAFRLFNDLTRLNDPVDFYVACAVDETPPVTP